VLGVKKEYLLESLNGPGVVLIDVVQFGARNFRAQNSKLVSSHRSLSSVEVVFEVSVTSLVNGSEVLCRQYLRFP
jgi:hypothetical protein